MNDTTSTHARAFRLESPNFSAILNPDPERIAWALDQLTGNQSTYLILSTSNQFFVQCTGSVVHGFHLEYREGTDTLYQADPTPLEYETTLDCLARYALADPTWNDQIT